MRRRHYSAKQCFAIAVLSIILVSLVWDLELAKTTALSMMMADTTTTTPRPPDHSQPSTQSPTQLPQTGNHSTLPPQLESLSRVWNYFNETNRCLRPSEEMSSIRGVSGFWYVKIPKTSSSTMAGIAIRIARKVGERKWPMENQTCAHRFKHGSKHALPRNGPGVLWTFLRDPVTRAISEFYHFQVSRRHATPNDIKTKRAMESLKSFQVLYAAGLSPKKRGKRAFDYLQILDQAMSKYDFVGLLERRWESIAVMKLLWGLQTSDMIVLSSKSSGGYDDGKFRHRCNLIQKSPPFHALSPPLQDYIRHKFPRGNHDYELYAIVNRSLDMTIDAIGREIVETEVRLLRATQAYADEECKHTAIFPCSSNGTRQIELSKSNCYNGDAGCGYHCTDELLLTGYTIPSTYFPA